MSVSRTVSEIFSVKEWGDLETEDRGRLRLGGLRRNIAVPFGVEKLDGGATRW